MNVSNVSNLNLCVCVCVCVQQGKIEHDDNGGPLPASTPTATPAAAGGSQGRRIIDEDEELEGLEPFTPSTPTQQQQPPRSSFGIWDSPSGTF
jgi:hypothetical protein